MNLNEKNVKSNININEIKDNKCSEDNNKFNNYENNELNQNRNYRKILNVDEIKIKSMKKEEAIKAMQTHRVRHRYFSKEEWVTQCTNGMLCLEDGVMCDPEEFWRYRQGSVWDDGWEIIPNPERSVG